MGPREREIDHLERELESDDLTAADRKALVRGIRDIERDLFDEDQWRDQGIERGWGCF